MTEEGEEEEFEVAEEVEEILGMVLAGLKDKDTIVRWSAAKGCVLYTCNTCMLL